MELIVTTENDLKRLIESVLVENAGRLTEKLAKATAPKEWLSNREAMEYLGVSKATLQRLRSGGRLAYSKVAGLIYYKYEDLCDLLESSRVR